MGCGNSSPATTNSSSSSNSAGRAESSSKASEEPVPEDDKWKNYGGVYVGFPADLSNIPQVHIGSLREHERDLVALRRPLWGDGL
ncbi:overexpressed in colon carcinoma 1 protein homolog isoform X2 [Centropristis striata]|uniref:overexpressed in colon carcinoma 1 protein homolog isoform X2 n=1 Tax=Centropristis striata TaxID=184440 RepID=UPI0027E07C32|nr:overexpressed in colon carcinoma 1 protein homolog isoform X2 [Centropristis striata]